jgi:OmpA-OmpF porin, OOP family
MKTLKIVLVSAVAATSLLANTPADLEISPYIGGHFFNTNRDLKNSVEGGVILEKALTQNGLAVAGSLGYTSTEKRSNNDDKKIGTYGLNLIKNYDLGSKLTPYVGAGVAGTTWESVKVGPNVLAGLKYKLSDAMNVRAEVSDNYLLNGKNDVKAILGLGFLFGGAKTQAVVASEPVVKKEEVKAKAEVAQSTAVTTNAAVVEKDSDGDGVMDSKDACPNTPNGLKVDDKGCFKSATLKVNFDTAKSVVKKQYMAEIANFAKFMNDNKSLNVTIEGHTDNAGNAKYNQKLSEKRANAIKDVLVKEYKVSADRIKAVGYGQAKPIASNATKEGKAENRRIMVVGSQESQK